MARTVHMAQCSLLGMLLSFEFSSTHRLTWTDGADVEGRACVRADCILIHYVDTLSVQYNEITQLYAYR